MKYGISYRLDCPICNSRAYLNQLSKEPRRLILHEMHGLGRGKGFKYIPTPIDDDFRKQFQERLFKGVLTIIDTGIEPEYMSGKIHEINDIVWDKIDKIEGEKADHKLKYNGP